MVSNIWLYKAVAPEEQFGAVSACRAAWYFADGFAIDEITNLCSNCVNYVCPLALREHREVLTATNCLKDCCLSLHRAVLAPLPVSSLMV